jgi:predicted DCC family thiol-disulfide oxidoreductase YuxK
MLPAERPVLFFDGECNLCNNSVQFIIRHDKQKRFLFAPLQSPAGQEALRSVSQTPTPSLNSREGAEGGRVKEARQKIDSLILLYRGRYYIRSSAALHTVRLLSGLWPVLYAGMILPRVLRDAVYDFISRNRYKWFGKRSECMIPTPELKERFIS